MKGVTFTQATRFPNDKEKIVGPGRYNLLELKNNKSNKFSFGRERRNTFDKKEEGNFRFYIDSLPENNQ